MDELTVDPLILSGFKDLVLILNRDLYSNSLLPNDLDGIRVMIHIESSELPLFAGRLPLWPNNRR